MRYKLQRRSDVTKIDNVTYPDHLTSKGGWTDIVASNDLDLIRRIGRRLTSAEYIRISDSKWEGGDHA